MDDANDGLPYLNCWLVRAEDQLDIRATALNMVVTPKAGGGADLTTVDGGYLSLTFRPQHTMESIPTQSGEITTGQFPVFGPDTQLAFRVPAGARIPLTIEGILAAAKTLEPSVSPKAGKVFPIQPAAEPARVGDAPIAERLLRAAARVPVPDQLTAAQPADAADPLTPTPLLTGLKFPHRLSLSVRGGATRFVHPALPDGEDGQYVMWHTRLARLRIDGKAVEVPAELVVLPGGFQLSLDPADPWQQRVGDERLAPNGTLDKQTRTDLEALADWALNCDRLMLSSQGAWLEVDREFPPASSSVPPHSLVSYRHKLTMGRDVTIRVAKVGTLLPLGHRALLVTVVDRVFDPQTGKVARLHRQTAVTVLEKTRTYLSKTEDVRAWPWPQVTVMDRSTPQGKAVPYKTTVASELQSEDGTPMTLSYLGIDRGGRSATFELPVIFVPDGTAAVLKTVLAKYNAAPESERALSLGGQVITVAEPLAEAPEAADIVTEQLVLAAAPDPLNAARPMGRASTLQGRLPALETFAALPAGSSAVAAASPAPGDSHVVRFTEPYLKSEFSTTGNPVQSLFQLVSTAPVVGIGDPAVTGGLVAPSFSLETVSRLVGPIGGKLQSVLTGKVKATDLLAGVLDQVTLFGVFPLAELIGDLDLDVAKDVPKLVTKALDGVATPSMKWTLPLFQGSNKAGVKAKKVDAGPVSGEIRPRAGRVAQLVIDLRTERAGQDFTVIAECSVVNVELALGLISQELVVLPVDKIFFRSVDGRKPEIDLTMGKPQFRGVLTLLKTLADQIPGDGFADPPALDVRSDGIRSSYSVPIPDLAAGAFALSNIRFGAALDLWYEKAPELSLDFATQQNRFRVAVLGLSGGGYLGVRLSTNGLEELQGMLEFGASVSVNLGVAKGSVSLMAGVHFKYVDGGDAWIEGYVDLRGELEVLKVVEIGVKLFIALTYHLGTGELAGRAELEVRVRVLFFRKTVRVPFEYTLVGAQSNNSARAAGALTAAGVPGYTDQLAPAGWPKTDPLPLDTYCLAFA